MFFLIWSCKMRGSLTVLLLIFTIIQLTLSQNLKNEGKSQKPVLIYCHLDTVMLKPKRDAAIPEWGDLGWAWKKRNALNDLYPKRLLRSSQLVKNNPEWHDLGWTWGRRK
ncbi:hypothetical protein DICVIV_01518 [Dictyocaulus viviparus]|uniref:Uncharacterized protein n=1 Tax=Dictyocaulus viviparus TaxID=29172 RepID=A0A0D8YCL6_DICVI|nr:hypothetical protein DICVIV_01518 [Dictyocaulus viviparus]